MPNSAHSRQALVARLATRPLSVALAVACGLEVVAGVLCCVATPIGGTWYLGITFLVSTVAAAALFPDLLPSRPPPVFAAGVPANGSIRPWPMPPGVNDEPPTEVWMPVSAFIGMVICDGYLVLALLGWLAFSPGMVLAAFGSSLLLSGMVFLLAAVLELPRNTWLRAGHQVANGVAITGRAAMLLLILAYA